jgi:3-dehydroquinate dehydratase type I
VRICIPIQAETNKEARTLMNRAHALVNIVELRIDGMKDPDLRGLLKEKKGQVLVTNRRREEGGAYDGPEKDRVKLLMEAVSHGADYVDLEASTDMALIMRLKTAIEDNAKKPASHQSNFFPQGKGSDFRAKLILSWHDFTGTPSERVLRKKCRDMTAIGPDIIKMVTYAKTMADNLRILNLVPSARRDGHEIIAFCMGALGRSSRVMSVLMGSYITYAALAKGAESAPGQLTVDEMKKMWDILAS